MGCGAVRKRSHGRDGRPVGLVRFDAVCGAVAAGYATNRLCVSVRAGTIPGTIPGTHE